MKKLTTIFMILIILFTGFTMSSEAQLKQKQFTDIDGHWAEQSINELNKYGMISGYADGTFRPNATVSRAEIIAWVTRIMKHKMTEEEYQIYSSPRDTKMYELSSPMSLQDYFKDYADLKMPSNYWAKQAIEEGKWLQLLPYDGINPKKVYLDKEDYYQPVTRGEVAYCITRSAEWFKNEFPTPDKVFYSYATETIKDVENCPEYPVQCYIAYLQGFFGGYSDKTFRPEKPITRAEATAVLLKLLEPERAIPFKPDEVPIKLYHMNYSPNNNTSEMYDMIPEQPLTFYPPYYRAEKKVVHEVLELAKIMDNSASELHNYEEGGYRNLCYGNDNGILSINFGESYKRFIYGLNYNEYLKDTDLGSFLIDLGNLKNTPKRNDGDNRYGCIYEFKLNNHWDELKEYHWDTIEDICNYLFEDDTETILNKIKAFSNKAEFEYKTEYLYLNGRKVNYREFEDGNLMITIEVK